MNRANARGNFKLELRETVLTDYEADEMRSFILSLEPRPSGCLVQPDVIDVFDIDETAVKQIVAKLREIGLKRAERRAQATIENQ